jgi:Bacteriocin-protection, YdeI or OmpD-Associated
MDITPLARWDWIRWIGATRNRDTRAIRMEKTLSKLRSRKRAACCFNRRQCTDPSMSRNGMLLEPTPAKGKAARRQASGRSEPK